MFSSSSSDFTSTVEKRRLEQQELRKERRNKMTKPKEEELPSWELHNNPGSYKIPDYLVPEYLSINSYNDMLDSGNNIPLVFPYRSARKMKSLEHTMPQINLLNAKSYRQLNNMIPHYNNFNVHDSYKKYSLKSYSPYRHSYIGDLFFEGDKSVFLLLINVNTRYLYAYQLGQVESNEMFDQSPKYHRNIQLLSFQVIRNQQIH